MGLSKETSLPAYDGEYLALSNFYYTPKFLESFKQYYPDLFEQDNLETLELKSVGRKYCEKNWKELRTKYEKKPEKEFLSEYCFMAAYIPILLTEVFGEKSINGRVMLRLKGSKADVDWTLGALICLLYDCRSGS